MDEFNNNSKSKREENEAIKHVNSSLQALKEKRVLDL